MELRSTGAVWRQAVDNGMRPEQADRVVDQYLKETMVILRNEGDLPFSGEDAFCDGVEYAIPPGGEITVPLYVAMSFLGNWATGGTLRAIQHHRCKIRYGAFDQVDQRDLELYNLSLRTYSELKDSGGVSKEDKKIAKSLIRPLPVPRPLPQLAVLDPETKERLPVSWPLYDKDGPGAPETGEVTVEAELAELRSMLEDVRRQRAERTIVGVIEAEDE